MAVMGFLNKGRNKLGDVLVASFRPQCVVSETAFRSSRHGKRQHTGQNDELSVQASVLKNVQIGLHYQAGRYFQ
jgi:hypothetical protein